MFVNIKKINEFFSHHLKNWTSDEKWFFIDMIEGYGYDTISEETGISMRALKRRRELTLESLPKVEN